MKTFILQPERFLALLFAFALSFVATGCGTQLVAKYDAVAFEEILAVGKKVDTFYGNLLETDSKKRTYSAFSKQYVELEADIRGIVTRNAARPLNSESEQIAKNILNEFTKYRDNHKTNHTYSDGNARLDRNRLNRMFAHAAGAEKAKNLTVANESSNGEDK